MAIRVFLAISVLLYREGLRAVLEKRNEVQVVGDSGDFGDAAGVAMSSGASVVVVDVGHPEAALVIRGLRSRAPRLRVLAFAVEDRLEAVMGFAEAGAHGFFSANGAIDDLVLTVVKLAEGEMTCSSKVAGELLAHVASRSMPYPCQSSLTSREREVLQLLQRGCSNKEIARAMSISCATVKNHVHHLLEKMQVKSRTQVLARYGASGLIDTVR